MWKYRIVWIKYRCFSPKQNFIFFVDAGVPLFIFFKPEKEIWLWN